MKILICISHVPDTTARIAFVEDNTKYDKSDVQFIISPYEELALTRALEIKEKIGDVQISVLNIGLPETEPTLRKALAIGADDAIRVNAEATDAMFVAKQIAEVAKSGDYDLILTGKESIDYNGFQVGEMVAEFLDIPSITSASSLNIEKEKGLVEREIDGGKELISTSLPFVASGQKGIAKEPRIPSMRGIMMSRRKPLKVVEAVEFKPFTQVLNYKMPTAKAACKMIDPENPEELVRLLHEEAKVI
ncbi:MAG: electron transfer flavoprotein subunit beta/FixA family protein [Bacteroidetes bacterium]|jgi:electron transfer flavoprotein beta subunit|nr:electron transfer flavoprotein subunit beta/FixA family protein [Bacteroidota bacterium]MBT6687089.1 electron transfer flavoprotein subunit beta/FixA family protein [Bacteroidota bacterium]MBT7144496.1 electron transfer flavoprotein subunit beta/FixA family protein [Bacteroidota bacterium]MBT7490791.1 electron transfer flavoprotein subunit beta/FixA family protein [Bacteroidota bacterium]